MAEITFTLSAAHLTRVVTAYTAVKGYQPIIDGLPNPETQQAFTKRMIAQDIKDVVRGYENEQAIRALVPATEIVVT